MPGKHVSQATFDAIVREAISDFGLSPEQALVEARSQLSLAGVTDFSSIITSTPSSSAADHPALRLVSNLEAALSATQVDNRRVSAAADELAAAASADAETRGVAGARGALDLTLRVHECGPCAGPAASRLLCALLRGCESNRSALVTDTRALPRVAAALERRLGAVDALAAALAVVQRCERAKEGLGVPAMEAVLRRLYDCEMDTDVVRGCCALLRALLAQDDDTCVAPQTFVRAKVLCGLDGGAAEDVQALGQGVPTLPVVARSVLDRFLGTKDCSRVHGGNGTRVSEEDAPGDACGRAENAMEYGTDGVLMSEAAADAKASNCPGDGQRLAVLSDCLAMVRMCSVSDEICQMFMDLEFPDIAFSLLLASSEVEVDSKFLRPTGSLSARFRSGGSAVIALYRICLSLLRSLAARDDAKALFCGRMGGVCTLVRAHVKDSAMCERFCGLVAAVALRRPDLAATLVDVHGAAAVVVLSMQQHVQVCGLQKVACLALRNLVVRNDTTRRRVVEDGSAEAAVRAAMANYPAECGDAAYNALYDMDVLEDAEIRRDRRYTTPF